MGRLALVADCDTCVCLECCGDARGPAWRQAPPTLNFTAPEALTKQAEPSTLQAFHTLYRTFSPTSNRQDAGLDSQRRYPSPLRDFWLSPCLALDLGELPAAERISSAYLTLVVSYTASQAQAQSSSAISQHSQRPIMSSFPTCAATVTLVNRERVTMSHA
jgi:hypothetical protein